MSTRLDELQRQKEDLDALYASAKVELKQARQKAKDKRRSQSKVWQLGATVLHTVLVIYALAGYVTEPAVKFLQQGGRQRRWPSKTEEELAEMVEEYFLKVDLAEFALLTDTQNPSDLPAMRAALVCVEEWRLTTWAAQSNADCGVAPSTASVLQRWEDRRAGIAEEVRPRYLGTSADARARVWAWAWRRRWGGKHGRIRVQEPISLEELRTKAWPRNLNPRVQKNRSSGSRSGSRFGYQK